ncbi:hypothetical protein LPC08_25355 (plasmid) [Roseomonas sp. OT10]|uniref:hypothetical protein n=1 Tax=Roseomonas cutis TaxID=2897332 RepID=UPI001E5E52D1|nr:hypothetical protein [Roseomonas sp. OT10]UFN51594.1 hypothetical protein LPC08_25355 [Roseomonas sp. OT10]
MRDQRSATQILFGFLPDQTVDAKGSVWKVSHWRQPGAIRRVYTDGLRSELKRLASPWEAAGTDDGFVQDMHARTDLEVVSVSREDGVQLEPFPRVWVCRTCNRIHDAPTGNCQCGSSDARGQLPFVGFHSGCGDLIAPYLPRCPTHKQVRVRWPGTSSAREIQFECPVCNRVTQRGFVARNCTCGVGDPRYVFQVHRASSVFTPRSCVMVNPPSNERIQEITDAGGPARALRWVLDGMAPGGIRAGRPTRDALTRELKATGLSDAVIAAMVQAAEAAGELADDPVPVALPEAVREEAEKEAVTIALSMAEPRATIAVLRERSAHDPVLAGIHGARYGAALSVAGLETVELIDRFPVLTAQFGYTRGGGAPGEDRLRTYRTPRGGYTIYGDLAQTEALLFWLAPLRVHAWLVAQGYSLPPAADDRAARVAILSSAVVPHYGQDPDDGLGSALLTLVHSYAHRVVRAASVFAGIERSALSELLVPRHLGFYVYGAARGDFVLGGLQAVFDTELHRLLDAVVHDESRCALDPGCTTSGGACPACLHLGEPSCRAFNRYLDRGVLFGDGGYLRA